jgi:hypothetical protein
MHLKFCIIKRLQTRNEYTIFVAFGQILQESTGRNSLFYLESSLHPHIILRKEEGN